MKKIKEKDPIDQMVVSLGKSRRYIQDYLYLASPLVPPGQTKEQFLKEIYSPAPGSRSKMPYHINMALNLMSKFCPVCGDCTIDRRFKGKTTGHSLFTRRFTDTSVTRECRCGLRFNFTWRTFVNVMKNKLKNEKDERMKYWLEIWITMTENYFGLNEESKLTKIEALRKRSRKTT